MTAAPAVSVLIPARDAAETIELALRSVARQRFGDFECIVVDDGSRDDTATRVRRFAARDDRFTLLARPHGGIVAALETGLDACRGRYVARMAAADWMHRLRLELQVQALEAAASLCGVGSHVRIFPRAGLSPGLRAYERWLNSLRDAGDVAREAFIECPLVHPTLCIRREVLLRHRYRAAEWPEDYDLVLRLLAAGEHLGMVPRRLLSWRDRPDRLTRTASHCGQERIVACKANYLAAGFLASTDRYVLWGYGDTGRSLSRALAEHGKQLSEIVELHPGRIGQRIHGALVIHPDQLGAVRERLIVVSVAGAVARAQIRAALASFARVEGVDYVIAA